MAKSSKTLKSGLHALVWKEDKWYVAKCAEVEVASQGKTKPEALSNLEEALELYFENEKAPLPQGLANPQIHSKSGKFDQIRVRILSLNSANSPKPPYEHLFLEIRNRSPLQLG